MGVLCLFFWVFVVVWVGIGVVVVGLMVFVVVFCRFELCLIDYYRG